MMAKRNFIIVSEAVRERAIEWLRQLPLKSVVRTDDKPTRSGAQNDRFHAMIDDVAAQIMWRDVFQRPIKMTRENWKRFFLQMFKRETLIVPNEDGTGFYDLGVRSSELSVSEMSDCMELIAAFGAQRGVKFKDMADA
jgi:hypothetical protein